MSFTSSDEADDSREDDVLFVRRISKAASRELRCRGEVREGESIRGLGGFRCLFSQEDPIRDEEAWTYPCYQSVY